MSFHARSYAELAGLDAMRRVLIEGRRASPHSGYIHLGDLNWWLFYLLRDYRLEDIAFLWEDGVGRVCGWSLLTPHLGAFDLFVSPEERVAEQLAPMLAWTEARLVEQVGEQPPESLVTMWVFDDDALWRAVLEQRGYRRDPAYGLLYMRHTLDAIPAPELPDGFRLAHVTDEIVEARAAAHRAAFGSARMTPGAYRQLRRAPDYRAERDVVTLAPGGDVASYIMGWYDAENRVAEFEPVGTAPAFQRRGLGRAAMCEGLRRVQSFGAREAIVYAEIDNPASQALYRSAGFRPTNRIGAYRRPLNGP